MTAEAAEGGVANVDEGEKQSKQEAAKAEGVASVSNMWPSQVLGDLIQAVNGTNGSARLDEDSDGDLQAMAGSYWHSAPRSLVAFRNRSRGEPKEIARQAVWWIRRVEQRFLFGYCWELLSDTDPVLFRRLTISLASDNTISVCVYGGEDGPATGTGTFDGRRFTVHMMDGDLVHWAQMVRTKDLDKVLPGCTVTINQLLEMHPVSGTTSSQTEQVSGCAGSCPLAGALLSWLSGTGGDEDQEALG